MEMSVEMYPLQHITSVKICDTAFCKFQPIHCLDVLVTTVTLDVYAKELLQLLDNQVLVKGCHQGKGENLYFFCIYRLAEMFQCARCLNLESAFLSSFL